MDQPIRYGVHKIYGVSILICPPHNFVGDTKGTVKLINLKQTDNAMAKNEKNPLTMGLVVSTINLYSDWGICI